MQSIWPRAEWVNNHRRAVLAGVLLFVVALVLARYIWLTPLSGSRQAWIELGQDVIDGIVSSVLISGVIAAFLWWMGPRPERIPPGSELPPDSIGGALTAAALATETWEYVGHTGRDFRSRIIPLLVRRIPILGHPLPVRVNIIDPAEEAAARAYCTYRRSSRSASLRPNEWTPRHLRVELLATIILILDAAARYPQLSFQLGLAVRISVFRYDRSDNVIVVTQEDPQQPAFLYPRGSRFYDYYRRECDLAWAQARPINIAHLPEASLAAPETIEAALRTLFGDRFDRVADCLEDAIKTARANQPPYA
ncbi:MAG: hypothetical protein KYX67_00020 [Brevundimonas sp.]|uniref:hypothetical protein n=1 Tax=Brevundimonas sp. TaxID=1871086 RepID=UPI00256E746C|nr:hypothetical protein [Brevundimonas sp.]MDK2745692.1 hypothetical protein [Brevundimonas sp.]